MNLRHYMVGVTDPELLDIYETYTQATWLEPKGGWLREQLIKQWYARKAAMRAAGMPIRDTEGNSDE